MIYPRNQDTSSISQNTPILEIHSFLKKATFVFPDTLSSQSLMTTFSLKGKRIRDIRETQSDHLISQMEQAPKTKSKLQEFHK